MPAITTQEIALHARDWRNTVGQSGMTPTAFAFLIPVFVVAIAAPFLCVFCIRKRRQPVAPTPRIRKPALQRAEARERLNSVTEVSHVTESQSSPKEDKTSSVETRSVLERECAICLSTLHAPSPPEPAKLSAESITDEATKPPSAKDVTLAEPEQILKLQVCGHEFHAECLVSWVVLRKTSCPICRAVYLSKEEMQSLDDEAQLAETPTPAVVEAQTAAPISNWRYFLHGHNVFSSSSRRQNPQQPRQPPTRLQRLMTRG